MGDKERSDKELKIPGLGPKRLDSLNEHGVITYKDLANIPFNYLLRIPLIGFKTAYSIKTYLDEPIDYPSMKDANDIVFPGDVKIENKTIFSWKHYKDPNVIEMEPKDFKPQRTTVWSFPERGNWASHTPHYRGNWSPYVARNVIELYSEPGENILDPMVGGGTTPVECMLMGRNSISVDINPAAIQITNDRLNMPLNMKNVKNESQHKVFIGDVRRLNKIDDGSIDLIATHPPYANIIKYGPKHDGDLSLINDYGIFFKEFSKAIDEFWRVLKPGKYCAILIGDTHNRGHFVPISHRMMLSFLKRGFILKEDIIKKEWNCESDRYLKKYSNSNFLLTMHEHLFIFRKPSTDERWSDFKNSSLFFFEPRQEG